MGTGATPSWWDRDLDSAGNPIRADVRSAARELWDYACQKARTFLGDDSEAPELMEKCVLQVSRYLDRRAVPLFEENTKGLLLCAFYRSIRRQISKLRRFTLMADFSSIKPPRLGRPSVTKEDCRLDAEKLLHQLNDRVRHMYELRDAGHDWKEIATIFNTTEGAARTEFSRELKRLKTKLVK
jgi:DNA-directed RNA polymerase specialized sigma24 family protein